MEVHFTPEQEAHLARIASITGTEPERLVKDAVLRLLEGDAKFRAVAPGTVVAEMRALRARVNLTQKTGQRAITSAMAAAR